MALLEKATIEIKGKKYDFLKPRAMDMIELEDNSLDDKGELDFEKYADGMLKFVSPELKMLDFVKFQGQNVVLSSGEEICIDNISYAEWKTLLKDIKGFSRLKLAKCALKVSGVSGEISLDCFKYEDIDNLAMAMFKLYDSTELNEVMEKISEHCF